jgi:hypothetical protein
MDLSELDTPYRRRFRLLMSGLKSEEPLWELSLVKMERVQGLWCKTAAQKRQEAIKLKETRARNHIARLGMPTVRPFYAVFCPRCGAAHPGQDCRPQ